ncbi:hypothetical protein EW146_g6290 [Bondarzewia mesenterica]|uniref:Integrase catalytic domain-containing protein n=1 Tax=Bondarzewia mesenterica TaxID=1095465 RepID=A0A4S4LP48_9AGAM|nr:hypothetical protein EW146_g6290 [Bondarzewia mesenterica]
MSSSQNFYNVPKLASDGSNWVMYKTRLENAIKARGLVRHLTGSITRPANPEAYEEDYTPSLREILECDAAEQKVAKFEQDEASVKQQIFSTITDSLLLRLQSENHTTTKDLWGAISKEYEQKSDIAKSKEQLAGMGTKIEDEDFSATIMSSLPLSYRNSLRVITSAAHVTEKPLSPVTLMQFILERGHTKAECRGPGGGGAGGGDNRGDAGGKAPKGNASANAATHAEGFMATINAAALTALDSDNVVSSSTMTTCVDTGASHHMSSYRDHEQAHVHGAWCGTLEIALLNGDGTTSLILRDVLYALEIALTLLSVPRVDAAGYELRVKDGESHLINPQGETIGQIPQSNGLYRFVSQKKSHVEAHAAVKELVKKGLVEGITLDEADTDAVVCESCIRAKIKRAPFPAERSSPRASRYAELLHSDLDDHSSELAVFFQKKKSETITSYDTHRNWIEVQRGQKIGTLCTDRGDEYLGGEFQQMLKANGTHHELTVHDSPQQNGCSECLNGTLVMRTVAMLLEAELPKFFWAEAVNHCVWIWNCTGMRALLRKTPLEVAMGKKPNLRDLHEWGCRVWVKVEGRDKLASKADEGHFVGYDSQSKGYQIYWPKKRSIDVECNIAHDTQNSPRQPFLDEDGTKSAPSTSSADSSPKTSPKSSPKRLTDDEDEAAVSNVLGDDSSSETSETDAVSHFPDHTGIAGLPDDIPNASDAALEPAGRPRHEIRPSAYVRRLQSGEGIASGLPGSIFPGISPLGGFAGMVEVQDDADGSVEWEEVSLSAIECALVSQVTSGHEPRTVMDARRRADWPKWEAAINSELAMIHKLETWELVDRPPNTNVVGSKWVFKVKRGSAGEIVKYKARLVAQGFTQVPGIDYTDTFVPIAKLDSIRVLLAIAARNDWEVHQMDVKNAYLNGHLEEDIFMEQPPGFIAPGAALKVCRLFKTIYGLKQSGRCWYQRLCEAFVKLGFTRCSVDHGVFYKHVAKDILVISASVDDLALFASVLRLLEWLKGELSKVFEMTDLGEIHWLLGMEIKRDQKTRTISLSQ